VKTRRFFAHSRCRQGDTIILSRQQCHHLKDVLRLGIGDTVRCFSETGLESEARIASFADSGAFLTVIEDYSPSDTRLCPLILAQSLVKASKMDFIIQKAVELGCTEIIPFFSDHSIIQLDERRQESKQKRWYAIAVEAAKQCGRADLPVIHDCVPFARLVDMLKAYDITLFADPAGTTSDIRPLLKPGCTTAVAIGPEGGFSPAEKEAARQIPNCHTWTFNRNTARAETAAVAALSIIAYEYELISQC
jgi:16S rRNA (uracil1498-N3)-methyltransferase